MADWAVLFFQMVRTWMGILVVVKEKDKIMQAVKTTPHVK